MLARHAFAPIGLGALLGALVKVIPPRSGIMHPSVMGMAGDTLPAGSGARSGRGGLSLHAPAMVERVACPGTVASGRRRHGATAQPTATPGCQAPSPRPTDPPCNHSGSSWGSLRSRAVRCPGSFTQNGHKIHFSGARAARNGHISRVLNLMLAVESIALVVAVIRNFLWS